MATCKYCGKSAGLFFKAHKACEQRHKQGMAAIESAMRSYFMGALDAGSLAGQLTSGRNTNFLSDDDVATLAAKAVDEYTTRTHWPYQHRQLVLVQDFLNVLGVPRDAVNRDGAIDRLVQKMIRGFMAEYFTGQKTLQRSLQISRQVTQALPIAPDKEQEAYYDILANAGHNFTQGGTVEITTANQQKVNDFVGALGLSLADLPEKYQNSELQTLEQNRILAELQQGRLPQTGLRAPVVLARGEALLWRYPDVEMLQEKIHREYVGRSGGFSFRVARGVTYRTGGFKGRPVESSYMDLVDIGSLYVTNKNLIFQGLERGLRVPYRKIVGVQPYNEGLEVQRDGTNAKRLLFQGFDCSFVLNVLGLVTGDGSTL